MQDERISINEITELFSNPDNIRADMDEAFGLMTKHFHHKYVSKMTRTVENYREAARKNPSDEIRLLKAWKPFIPEEAHGRLDGFIDALHTINTFKNMSGEAVTAWAASADKGVGTTENARKGDVSMTSSAEVNSSVHHDGVYDIDEQCYSNHYANDSSGFENIAGILMLFALIYR